MEADLMEILAEAWDLLISGRPHEVRWALLAAGMAVPGTSDAAWAAGYRQGREDVLRELGLDGALLERRAAVRKDAANTPART